MATTKRVPNDPTPDPKADEQPNPTPDEKDTQGEETKGDAKPPTTTAAAPKAARTFDPRAAEKLPPGMPQGFDQDGTRKKYRVLCSFVLDDDGMEVPEGGVAELSDSLAARYTDDNVIGGYGPDNTAQRHLIEPLEDEDEE